MVESPYVTGLMIPSPATFDIANYASIGTNGHLFECINRMVVTTLGITQAELYGGSVPISAIVSKLTANLNQPFALRHYRDNKKLIQQLVEQLQSLPHQDLTLRDVYKDPKTNPDTPAYKVAGAFLELQRTAQITLCLPFAHKTYVDEDLNCLATHFAVYDLYALYTHSPESLGVQLCQRCAGGGTFDILRHLRVRPSAASVVVFPGSVGWAVSFEAASAIDDRNSSARDSAFQNLIQSSECQFLWPVDGNGMRCSTCIFPQGYCEPGSSGHEWCEDLPGGGCHPDSDCYME
ncbi:MAG: hypothetical protein HYV26_19340 [Candidatus Hydrogenedentes bacterium]|nr:hypothetical protein [Candidatus Hydrogenedentota bacterium]